MPFILRYPQHIATVEEAWLEVTMRCKNRRPCYSSDDPVEEAKRAAMRFAQESLPGAELALHWPDPVDDECWVFRFVSYPDEGLE